MISAKGAASIAKPVVEEFRAALSRRAEERRVKEAEQNQNLFVLFLAEANAAVEKAANKGARECDVLCGGTSEFHKMCCDRLEQLGFRAYWFADKNRTNYIRINWNWE